MHFSIPFWSLSRKAGLRGLYLFVTAAAIAGAHAQDSAEPFRYGYYKGLEFRTVSEIDERVYQNRQLLYSTEITNRVAVQVLNIENGTATLQSNMKVLERAEKGNLFIWNDETNRTFQTDGRGRLIKSDLFPSLNHIPVFPEEPIRPGSRWTAAGTEVIDLKPLFQLDEKIQLETNVSYLYRNTIKIEGKSFALFSISYRIEEDLSGRFDQSRAPLSLLPETVRGDHDIELYWDAERDLPVRSSGSFETVFQMRDGTTYRFEGYAAGRLLLNQPLQMESAKRELEEELRKADLQAEVTEAEDGLSISIDHILFVPDQASMLPGQEQKLEKISKVLFGFPEQDIMIIGHTADTGQPESEQKLSEERAAEMARYFLRNGVKSENQMIIKGAGAAQPVTEDPEESEKNRRVEITLLGN